MFRQKFFSTEVFLKTRMDELTSQSSLWTICRCSSSLQHWYESCSYKLMLKLESRWIGKPLGEARSCPTLIFWIKKSNFQGKCGHPMRIKGLVCKIAVEIYLFQFWADLRLLISLRVRYDNHDSCWRHRTACPQLISVIEQK